MKYDNKMRRADPCETKKVINVLSNLKWKMVYIIIKMKVFNDDGIHFFTEPVFLDVSYSANG